MEQTYDDQTIGRILRQLRDAELEHERLVKRMGAVRDIAFDTAKQREVVEEMLAGLPDIHERHRAVCKEIAESREALRRFGFSRLDVIDGIPQWAR